MANIDDILEQLLGDRRFKEGAAFSSRTYGDQPLIERGSDFKTRMERRANERAERRSADARARRERARKEQDARARQARQEARRPQAPPQPQPSPRPQAAHKPQTSFGDWIASLDFDLGGQVSHTLDQIGLSPTPQPIKEMRKLENGGIPNSMAYGSYTVSSIFYQQAQLMQDYEDDYEFHGTFSQYYPTYMAMSNQQLRGYFSWRTRVRHGQVDPAPLSFAFVYVYELLCGIGTTPGEQGLRDLRAFGEAYRLASGPQGVQLDNYLHRWEKDYAVYHNIPQALGAQANDELGAAVLTLVRAEHAQLRAAKREPRIANESAQGDAPSNQQVFQALGNAATYHICDSRLAKDDPALVATVALDVFHELVMHCSKRRKTDFVEGLFGYASRSPYTMFSAAVFYEPQPHGDCTVKLSERETFTCTNGRWYRLLACDARGRNADLGLAMHAVDYELRQALDYAYPLKQRKVPKYLQKMVRDAIARRLAERAEAERRRITIDLSKLQGIRAAAAVTQEALLTDEERGEEQPAVAFGQAVVTGSPTAVDAGQGDVSAPLEASAPLDASPSMAAVAAPVEAQTSIEDLMVSGATSPAATTATAGPGAAGQGTSPAPAPAAPQGPLTPLEARFLAGLMEGTPVQELLSPTDPFPSVVADSINEAFFDLVGDAVIWFDGDTPHVVEDYLDDIREVLHV